MKLKIQTEKVVAVDDWDELVKDTYNRPYLFQQQDGCKERGVHRLTIPDEETYDFERDTVPEVVNHEDMGVSFKAWLERDPELKLSDPNNQNSWSIRLWWERNFYPDVQMIANDLHEKGLIEAGEYLINIDW
tara:strand:- start:13747 stop:14142 length:396 start_codon:yes stop_codon:yes gene_type:complete